MFLCLQIEVQVFYLLSGLRNLRSKSFEKVQCEYRFAIVLDSSVNTLLHCESSILASKRPALVSLRKTTIRLCLLLFRYSGRVHRIPDFHG